MPDPRSHLQYSLLIFPFLICLSVCQPVWLFLFFLSLYISSFSHDLFFVSCCTSILLSTDKHVFFPIVIKFMWYVIWNTLIRLLNITNWLLNQSVARISSWIVGIVQVDQKSWIEQCHRFQIYVHRQIFWLRGNGWKKHEGPKCQRCCLPSGLINFCFFFFYYYY